MTELRENDRDPCGVAPAGEPAPRPEEPPLDGPPSAGPAPHELSSGRSEVDGRPGPNLDRASPVGALPGGGSPALVDPLRVAPAGLTDAVPFPGPRPRFGVAIAVLLTLAAAAGLYGARTGIGPAQADQMLLGGSLAMRSSVLTALAVVVTNVGSAVAMAVLAIVVGSWCWWVRRRADAVLTVVAMAGGAVVFRGLKELLDRPRPPAADRLVTATSESLPSGHATMSMVVIGTLVVLGWTGRGPATRTAMVAAGAVWVGAVGATRVYLGVHWFSDVVAGWLVGGAWLAFCVLVRNRRRVGSSETTWRADRPYPSPAAR